MLRDLDQAEREIRAAVPDVVIDRFGDFGWMMVAVRSDKSGAIIVFQPPIDGVQQEIITPIEQVISYLRRPRIIWRRPS